MNRNPDYQLAIQDFQSAHLRAKLQGVLARITGKSNELLSYEEVASKLRLQGRSDKGNQMIPVDAIVGSVGRYTDFTRTFLPRRAEDQQRWANVKAAALNPVGAGLPPVEVYKVSDVYFVIDGNHRVSIARQEGQETIEAHVIEIRTDIPLAPNVQPDELIVKAEYADFLEQTGLGQTQEHVDLRLTIPGGYQKLLDEISSLRCRIEETSQKQCSLQDAAANWHRDLYLPFAEAVRERGMMRWFPERTIADLYVWMLEHREELGKELGWTIRPEVAAEAAILKRNKRASSEESKIGSWRKARLINRYSEHLFRDILVPIGKIPESWDALEQAITVAERENANILGLHTAESREHLKDSEHTALQARFHEICAEREAKGVLAVEIGEPTQKILERSALTDLIVIKISYPPSMGIKVMTSQIRNLIAHASRPILAITSKSTQMRRALLAFDGSPKAREALFVATYLAEQWQTRLTIFTGPEESAADHSAQEFAQNYLEFNEIEAAFINKKYSPEALRNTAAEIEADLVIMGGYSGSILKEMTVGSSVNFMLRESELPILICR
ncbi:MAG TPA: universal stress protein [Anaerolineales bacterium]|nr:universal stress protein [Anaerolineales bacterium]